jgi:hypothetical protein
MVSPIAKDDNGVPEYYWTAVGNIVRERPYGPGGAEIRFGTKHFASGAKAYIINWYAGMCRRIIVVGLHRKSKRFITLALDVRSAGRKRAAQGLLRPRGHRQAESTFHPNAPLLPGHY